MDSAWINTFLLDPVVVTAASAALSIIFIIGALAKWREGTGFRYAVENYGLVGAKGSALVALVMPVAEFIAGVAMLVPALRVLGFVFGIAVLSVATLAVFIKLLQGQDRIECGCGIGGQRISWGLVTRNGILASLLAVGAHEAGPRSLSLIDFFSVGACVLALLAVYASANQLLANQPLLKEIHS
ncbi:MAG TPA: MauE/DoxX family redox-associated membrane protein [Rhodocyclaceae bacterium]|nr:MauE/DoxX family redox-associated membrane protein [Rhodocyclaceae bacterium]